MLKIILLQLLLFISFSASADGLSVTLQKEIFTKNVQVSGQVRSGVMYTSEESIIISLPPEYIYLDLGSEGKKRDVVCGKIISADGSYEASFSTDQLKNSKGIIQIELVSDKYKNLPDINYNELAVLTYEGTRNCKKIGGIVPSSWSNLTSNKKSLVVYLNAGQFNTKLLLYPEGQKKPVLKQCFKIEGKRQVAYDTQCHIELDKGFNLARTKIKRSNGFSHAKIIKLPINLPQ